MSGIHVKCAYCGQLTKKEHCGYYKGVLMHNMPNCNCLQIAINKNFFIRKLEKWEIPSPVSRY